MSEGRRRRQRGSAGLSAGGLDVRGGGGVTVEYVKEKDRAVEA